MLFKLTDIGIGIQSKEYKIARFTFRIAGHVILIIIGAVTYPNCKCIEKTESWIGQSVHSQTVLLVDGIHQTQSFAPLNQLDLETKKNTIRLLDLRNFIHDLYDSKFRISNQNIRTPC